MVLGLAWLFRSNMKIARQLCSMALLCLSSWSLSLAVQANDVTAAVISTPQTAIAQCNRSEFQQVLQTQADTQAITANAIWLDHQLIQWPELVVHADTAARFRLVSSRQAALLIQPGETVRGADHSLVLTALGNVHADTVLLSPSLKEKFRYLHAGVILQLPPIDSADLKALLREQVMLVQENQQGEVMRVTRLQQAAALDDLYGATAQRQNLGVQIKALAGEVRSQFALWAPTAQRVSLCIYPDAKSDASAVYPALERAAESPLVDAGFEQTSGVWHWQLSGDLSGRYYRYLVDVFVPGVGIVQNLVTDPYSVSLSADSRRSYIADLDAPNLQSKLQPKGWLTSSGRALAQQTDMTVYELHVRDFSINDHSVPAAKRGKFLAFTEPRSNGMRHLRSLAKAGVTDIHLLPVFDFASVPERDCAQPNIRRLRRAASDSDWQQTHISTIARRDCFNWGYDPFHFNAPEGSYASNADDGARRVIEFRRMVMALHEIGLRVGMDVVFNHTAAAGQNRWSVLDRIVPGYYHRLNANGAIEQSTCCDNTATENIMMGKLLIDSVVSWATHYKIDSFRFDLMAHQPRALMEQLQNVLFEKTGRIIPLLGEGWNFGEVANGARFVQASQLALNGSGIGSFSDRARDALRGGGPADTGIQLRLNKGYINGLTSSSPHAGLLTDWVKVGLAGSLRDYVFQSADGSMKPMAQIDYHGQPAGYVSQPGEVVNYVENHDNQTLFDINVYKLPDETSRAERARVQMLGSAITALSQGIAYFHAGQDLLRSKSLDRNSFDSGDWFNRIDWTYRDNYFGSGLPPASDNAPQFGMMRSLLRYPTIKPRAREIRWTKNVFQDFLKIRASSTLFRMPTTRDIQQRLRFITAAATAKEQQAQHDELAPIVMHLDGRAYAGAHFQDIMVIVNVARHARAMTIDGSKGQAYHLHPVQAAPGAADTEVRQFARYSAQRGQFFVPPQSVTVFVQD